MSARVSRLSSDKTMPDKRHYTPKSRHISTITLFTYAGDISRDNLVIKPVASFPL